MKYLIFFAAVFINYLSACCCLDCCSSSDEDVDRGYESIVRDQPRYSEEAARFLRAVTIGNEEDAIAVVCAASKDFCEACLSISRYTVLHYACIYGFENLLQAIIDKVGNLNSIAEKLTRDEKTAYMLAMESGHHDLAETLYQHLISL